MTKPAEDDPHHSSYVIGEVEHGLGYRPPADLATALGYSSPKTLSRQLARWGRRDLANKLTEHSAVSVMGRKRV